MARSKRENQIKKEMSPVMIDPTKKDNNEIKTLTGREKMKKLTEREITEYAIDAVAQMSDDDRESIIADPESWRDGIETNHVIAVRADGTQVYCDDQWDEVRDALVEQAKTMM